MHSLLTFLYNYRSSFLFVLLESLSIFFIVNNNSYHQAAVLNSSNRLVASVMTTTNSVSEYFSLKEVNQRLAAENARLHELMISGEPRNNSNLLLRDSLALEAMAEDSVFVLPEVISKSDSVRMKQFAFVPAKVVDNTVHRAKNYVTINKGRLDGIEPDMGVISSDGVVGKVKDVSDHFAVITSVLHTDMFVSALVKRSSTLGSIVWAGTNPRLANLDNIPIHINIINGDTIVTSGYSGIYPPNTMIGTVSEVRPEEDAAFYDIDINLSNDFYKLSYVYVVKNLLRNEQDSLENIITADE
ncbi:rod shape-determining protein MreC [Catalinimonas alkaloidigena]|uniref:rod shape-determining protein MreC n=1 Tax=Catalinimonas alkaloidigena TaxID=1075417 RepID=UPI0024053177|nr:rod shape-determining protein MreC [Catalinimonas alkaloidigena]MDF9801069.1 rod shape-determining protein MreC [Catalinimonas alkaloidigena]